MIGATLRDLAEQIADSTKAQSANIENQLADVEKQQTKLDQERSDLLRARDAARSAHQRLSDFDGSSCPHCWIVDGERASLRSIGGGTDDHDVFHCTRCDRRIEVDF